MAIDQAQIQDLNMVTAITKKAKKVKVKRNQQVIFTRSLKKSKED
jgi:hypothetical protein